MFIAMNRFRISKGMEGEFEQLWRSRESHLDATPGFKQFNLLKGPETDEYTLYASHSTWESAQAFMDWTNSESFKRAHAQARAPKGTYLGHPELETYEVSL